MASTSSGGVILSALMLVFMWLCTCCRNAKRFDSDYPGKLFVIALTTMFFVPAFVLLMILKTWRVTSIIFSVGMFFAAGIWVVGILTEMYNSGSYNKTLPQSLLMIYTMLCVFAALFVGSNVSMNGMITEVFADGSGETIHLRVVAIEILKFIPIGSFMKMIDPKKYLVFEIIMYGGVWSALLEMAQLCLSTGVCDINDLIANMIGTAIGSIGVYAYLQAKKNNLLY